MPVVEVEEIAESSTDRSVELLREFERTGRPEPFEAFMRRHAAMVYATCLKVTRDPHDAEDATQATFLTLASKSRVNGEIRQPEAWLRKVAHRLALDLIRSKKRRVNRETLRSEMKAEIAAPDSHDRADAGEVKGILNEELAKLPASYRMPLILHYFGGLTRDEMAEQLKLKPSTLGVRLHRAREQLRRRLSGRGVALPGVALTALLAEVVRESVCAHLMTSTAHRASAIAMGHAAPMVFAAGGGGSGSIHAILNLLSHGKMKLMLSALVVSSAISLTSAQVQRFLPEALRSVLPTFRLQSLLPTLPRLDLTVPKPPRFARAEVADPSADAPEAYAVAPINGSSYNSAASRNVATFSSPTHVATSSATVNVGRVPARVPTAIAEPISIVRDLDRGGLMAAAPAAIARARTGTLIGIVGGPGAVRASRPAAVDASRPVDRNASTESAGNQAAPRREASNGLLGLREGDAAGPAVPASDAATAAAASGIPDRVLASVTGAPPPVPSYSGGSGGGGSSTSSAGSSSISHGRGIGLLSAASDSRANRVRPGSRTAVFTGTAANYGGFADDEWKPTTLTDLNGTLDDATPTDLRAGFDNGPAVPGESLSINGARVTLHQPGAAGTLDVSFLDATAASVPAFPGGHHFIGAWQLDSSTSFASADLLVRYDDLRAARLNLKEQLLKLWVSDGTAWSLMWLDPTFGRDVNANLLWVTAPGNVRFFAVSAPEPVAAAMLLAGASLLTTRRRRL